MRRITNVLQDTVNGFIKDDCYAKASALTFYTLLSIVPVLAVLFGVAKGFGFEKALADDLTAKFSDQPQLGNKLIHFAKSWLHNVQGGLIAGIGTVALFWTVLTLLGNIEATLNSIWKTHISRTFRQKITDYLAIIVIAPIVLAASSSVTIFLQTELDNYAHANIFYEAVSPVLLRLLKFAPFFLSSALFIFLYIFMPNTKVYLRAAIPAGILAGTIFQLWQWLYIKFQIGASNYGAIYGSFAAIPLFLVWLQTSWSILLGGAEFAFELENDMFSPNRDPEILSPKAIALLITYRAIEAFVAGHNPVTDRELGHELGLSLNHLHGILEALQNQKILAAVVLKDKSIGYQPARNIDTITFYDVSEAIEKSLYLTTSIQNSIQLQKIKYQLNKLKDILSDSHNNHVVYSFLKG